MIGHLQGKALFSDGAVAIIATASGVGHEVHCHQILTEGDTVSLYVSHVKRENSEELFAFASLGEKRLFELLTTVRGIGPKSAYTMLAHLGGQRITSAIATGDKGVLQEVRGVGPRAAAQVILDLKQKIQGMPMNLQPDQEPGRPSLIDEALMACAELGLKTDKVLPLAQKIAREHSIARPEELVQLMLKEL